MNEVDSDGRRKPLAKWFWLEVALNIALTLVCVAALIWGIPLLTKG